MAIKKIITYPDSILRKKTRPVTSFDEDLKQLVADLVETMYAAPGVGLAANQVGVSVQIAVIDISQNKEKREYLSLVNPKIIKGEGSQIGEEGCLSIPDYTAKVTRFKKITVKAQDLEGTAKEFEAEDHLARVIQHELDHLNGLLFIDRLSPLKRNLYKRRRKKELKEQQDAA